MLFLAYLSAEETAKLNLTALDNRATGLASARKRAMTVASVRRHRLARTLGGVLTGVNALAAPVFAENGRIAAVVSAYGQSASFDASWNGPVAMTLMQFTTQLSSIRRPTL
jgi:DNA-binding IclR family transcriptional regulator